jgi:hypothetical protein
VTLPPELSDRLGRAEAHVNAALNRWDAAQPAACEQACESLRKAIDELRCLHASLRLRAPGPEVAVIGDGLARIQAATFRMWCLADASAAFCRGINLLIGVDSTDVAHDSIVGCASGKVA